MTEMSLQKTVLVKIPIPETLTSALKEQYRVIEPGTAAPESILRTVAAVVTNGSTGLARATMENMPELELVCCFGAGHENIDLVAARERGIVVSNAPGLNNATVADHAIALCLALARDLVGRNAAVRGGLWSMSRSPLPTLNRAPAGIVGIGSIGQLIATRLTAFGAEVFYHSRTPRGALPWTFVPDVHDLANQCQFLILACPGGRETFHLIGSSVLDGLGPDGFLVNVARGTVVDTAALTSALKDRRIAGAGLDVLEYEPNIPEDLLLLDNVIFTPHMAGRSPAAIRAQEDAVLHKLVRHFAGDRIDCVVT
jgi:lactate dehydrogenase-like 2-hydroxyacid dehydrogenase